ncbi:MAG TPA: transporter substrate-binding domain-containing protein [Spirochaetia bacterium]|nr:transporter substrate-binding domain-containing protein [Spirochaetia bacterium]
MKKTFGILVALAVLAGAASADDLAKVKAAGALRVGTEGDYSPFTFKDAKGTLVGFDVEIAQEVAKRLGVKAVFTEGKWDGLIAGLDANRYDAVINEVTITDARKAKYDFSDPYGATKAVLIVKSADKSIKTFADLKGKKVVADLTTTYAQLARDNGAASVTSSDLPFDLVVQGRADATINDRLFFLDYKKQKPDVALSIVAENTDVDYQGVIVRKGNPDLVAAINKALKDLKADGTYLKISQKYFGEDISR